MDVWWFDSYSLVKRQYACLMSLFYKWESFSFNLDYAFWTPYHTVKCHTNDIPKFSHNDYIYKVLSRDVRGILVKKKKKGQRVRGDEPYSTLDFSPDIAYISRFMIDRMFYR